MERCNSALEDAPSLRIWTTNDHQDICPIRELCRFHRRKEHVQGFPHCVRVRRCKRNPSNSWKRCCSFFAMGKCWCNLVVLYTSCEKWNEIKVSWRFWLSSKCVCNLCLDVGDSSHPACFMFCRLWPSISKCLIEFVGINHQFQIRPLFFHPHRGHRKT